MGEAHSLRVGADRLILGKGLVHLAKVFKVGVLEGLACAHAVRLVVDEQLGNDLLRVRRHIRDQLGDAGALLPREVKLHVARHALELREELGRRRAEDVMDFVHLVELVVAREKREKGEDLKVHAADSPVVHLVIVIAVSEQALWRSVPPRANVLREGRLRVDATARAEVSQLHLVFFEEYVLSTGKSGVN